MTQSQIDKLTLLNRLDHIRNLLQIADNRAKQFDGNFLDHLTRKEAGEIWACSIVPSKLRQQGKQVRNSDGLNYFFKKNAGLDFYSIKGKVDGIFYEPGKPVEGEVNTAWVCKQTGERFDLIWE